MQYTRPGTTAKLSPSISQRSGLSLCNTGLRSVTRPVLAPRTAPSLRRRVSVTCSKLHMPGSPRAAGSATQRHSKIRAPTGSKRPAAREKNIFSRLVCYATDGDDTAIEKEGNFWTKLDAGQQVVFLCAIAMMLCNLDRLINSVTQIPIGKELGLSMTQLAGFQSAFLWGYGITQIAAGYLADKLGGAKVLLGGMALWSIATFFLPFGLYSFAPYVTIALARGLFGIGSGVAIPSVSAIVGQWVPPDKKTTGLSNIFACFHIGAALGPLLSGPMIGAFGWKAVYYIFGGLSLAWAAFAWSQLPEGAKSSPAKEEPEPAEDAGPAPSLMDRLRSFSPSVLTQLATMAYVHVAYNFCFFTLQAWIPVYLQPLFGEYFTYASALPWFLSAAVCMSVGRLADGMIGVNGRTTLDVRKFFLAVSGLVPAAALGLSCLFTTPWVAFALLMVAVGAQATFICAYHAHVQDVASKQAGVIVGTTNTLGIFASSAANVVVGYILDVTGSFKAVFLCTMVAYASMWLVGALFLKPEQLFPEEQAVKV